MSKQEKIVKVSNISWSNPETWWTKHERDIVERVLNLPTQFWKDLLTFLRKYDESMITVRFDVPYAEPVDATFYFRDVEEHYIQCYFVSPPFGDDLGLDFVLKNYKMKARLFSLMEPTLHA